MSRRMREKGRVLALRKERLCLPFCCHVFYLSLRQKKSSLHKVDLKVPFGLQISRFSGPRCMVNVQEGRPGLGYFFPLRVLRKTKMANSYTLLGLRTSHRACKVGADTEPKLNAHPVVKPRSDSNLFLATAPQALRSVAQRPLGILSRSLGVKAVFTRTPNALSAFGATAPPGVRGGHFQGIRGG